MADDDYDSSDALRAIDSIRAIAAKHAATPEQVEELTWTVARKIADPSFEVEQPEHPNVIKLRDAYHRWDRLPSSRDKMNYQSAIRSMLRNKYGAEP
jgi:hypothetical protein